MVDVVGSGGCRRRDDRAPADGSAIDGHRGRRTAGSHRPAPWRACAVTAPGFAADRDRVRERRRSRSCCARPASAESVVVTATRGAERLPSAASATVVTSAELANLGRRRAWTMCCATRPGFSLFRRNSSRVANPTTQGVTLRGVSGSGASRTLVLSDGVPLNDPFGSWVYWNRMPQAAVDRVEVVRGADRRSLRRRRAGRRHPGADLRARPHARARHHRRRLARHLPRVAVRRLGAQWLGRLGACEGTTTDGAYTVAPEAARPGRHAAPTATTRPASSPPAGRQRRLARLARGARSTRGARQRHAAPGQHHRLAARSPGTGGGIARGRRLAGARGRQQPGLLPDVHRRRRRPRERAADHRADHRHQLRDRRRTVDAPVRPHHADCRRATSTAPTPRSRSSATR